MKIYERNRDGKPYPVFEIDAIDLVQQYIQNCDVEQFIADYIGMGRCWHVNTRKFTGVLGGSPIYWCKTNKPYSPAQKGNAE